ncbi:hypothetical protein [Roseomonas sp. KE0001]|uniref:hypothetical protein n=1 Tax=Roseomonas sp. KE0001 TaxID=2479201 RepID=UPI0018DF5CAE|nr:hypothetical protein [Roseomonas sp. KE0001]
MADPLSTELRHLHETVEVLTQGLRMMAETQATHTEMLERILEAATEEPEDSPLPDLLQQIVTRLDEQTAVLQRIEAAATGMPTREDVEEEAAVQRGQH